MGVTESREWNAVLTTTFADHQRHIEDLIFDDYPLLSFVNGKLGKVLNRGKSIKKVHNGAESIVKNVRIGKNTTIKSYAGYELLDVTPQDNLTIARYDFKEYAGTVNISGAEKAKNRGSSRIVNLLEEKIDNCVMSMKDKMSVDLHSDGTGNGSKDVNGLQNIISTTSTLGGLNPTTYTDWVPYANASVGSWAGGGKDALRTAVNTITWGNDKPNLIITTQDIHEYVEKAEDPKERHANTDVLSLGFDNITFKGIPIVFDRDCASGYMWLLNSKYLSFDVQEGLDFKLSDFDSTIDQHASSAKLLFMGEFCTNNRRRLGVMSGITA